MKSTIGGELVLMALQKQNIDTAFTLVGNQVSPILVYADKYDIKLVDVRHEQGAIHMADAWSQIKRRASVAIVSGGPGFANSINGILKAYFAKTPMLVIIGATVNTQKDKNELQDMDQLGIIKQYTKWCATVNNVNRIPEYIEKALNLANTGRRGPVVLEIPINILKSKVNLKDIVWPMDIEHYFNFNQCGISKNNLQYLVDLIKSSKKPLIIAGDEAYYSFVDKELNEFIEYTKLPILTVNKARGVVPDESTNCFGNGRVLENGPSMYCYRNSDLIINLGVDNDYQMNFFSSQILNSKVKFINISELDDNNKQTECDGYINIKGNIKEILNELNIILKENCIKFSIQQWSEELKINEDKYWSDLYQKSDLNSVPIHPLRLIDDINSLRKKDTIIVLDGSNAMFWGGLLFKCNYPGQLIIGPDGTHGSMGCGVALAIGAKIAEPDKDVLLYTGDGSVGFNLIEIDTSIKNNIPITIVVHNDKAWGLCKSTQEILYEKVAAADLGTVRYDEITKGFGGNGKLVEKLRHIKPSLIEAIESKVTYCLNVIIDEKAESPGMIAFNEMLKKMK